MPRSPSISLSRNLQWVICKNNEVLWGVSGTLVILTVTKKKSSSRPLSPLSWVLCYKLRSQFSLMYELHLIWTSTTCQTQAIYSPFSRQPQWNKDIPHTPERNGAHLSHIGSVFSPSNCWMWLLHSLQFCRLTSSNLPSAGQEASLSFYRSWTSTWSVGAIREFTENISQRPDFVVSGELGLPCWIMSQHFLLWPTEMWFGQQTIAQCEMQSIHSHLGEACRPLKCLPSSEKHPRKNKNSPTFFWTSIGEVHFWHSSQMTDR